jgi:hypothetical protein
MTIGRIYLSKRIATKLGIPFASIINIRAGNIVTATKLIINSSKRNTYMLSPGLMRYLHLNKHGHLQLRYDANDNLIHIGHIIGILSSLLPNREQYDPKSIQAELIFLSKTGRNMPAQIFIFTPSSIDWNNLTTIGYSYYQNKENQGVWVSSIYPLPDVVYNRIATRAIENRNN